MIEAFSGVPATLFDGMRNSEALVAALQENRQSLVNPNRQHKVFVQTRDANLINNESKLMLDKMVSSTPILRSADQTRDAK
jgi:hypothetical protein